MNYFIQLLISCFIGLALQQETNEWKTVCKPIIMADVIFLLDGSVNIGKQNFEAMRQFAAEITGDFNIGDDVRFAVVIFHRKGLKQFDLDAFFDHHSLTDALLSLPYYGARGGNTHRGLGAIRSESLFDTDHGGREGAQRIIIVMTDGYSRNPRQTLRMAQKLKNDDVSILAVALGTGPNLEELELIATCPEYVFSLWNFSLVACIKSHFILIKCDETERLPSIIPPTSRSTEMETSCGEIEQPLTTLEFDVSSDEILPSPASTDIHIDETKIPVKTSEIDTTYAETKPTFITNEVNITSVSQALTTHSNSEMDTSAVDLKPNFTTSKIQNFSEREATSDKIYSTPLTSQIATISREMEPTFTTSEIDTPSNEIQITPVNSVKETSFIEMEISFVTSEIDTSSSEIQLTPVTLRIATTSKEMETSFTTSEIDTLSSNEIQLTTVTSVKETSLIEMETSFISLEIDTTSSNEIQLTSFTSRIATTFKEMETSFTTSDIYTSLNEIKLTTVTSVKETSVIELETSFVSLEIDTTSSIEIRLTPVTSVKETSYIEMETSFTTSEIDTSSSKIQLNPITSLILTTSTEMETSFTTSEIDTKSSNEIQLTPVTLRISTTLNKKETSFRISDTDTTFSSEIQLTLVTSVKETSLLEMETSLTTLEIDTSSSDMQLTLITLVKETSPIEMETSRIATSEIDTKSSNEIQLTPVTSRISTTSNQKETSFRISDIDTIFSSEMQLTLVTSRIETFSKEMENSFTLSKIDTSSSEMQLTPVTSAQETSFITLEIDINTSNEIQLTSVISVKGPSFKEMESSFTTAEINTTSFNKIQSDPVTSLISTFKEMETSSVSLEIDTSSNEIQLTTVTSLKLITSKEVDTPLTNSEVEKPCHEMIETVKTAEVHSLIDELEPTSLILTMYTISDEIQTSEVDKSLSETGSPLTKEVATISDKTQTPLKTSVMESFLSGLPPIITAEELNDSSTEIPFSTISEVITSNIEMQQSLATTHVDVTSFVTLLETRTNLSLLTINTSSNDIQTSLTNSDTDKFSIETQTLLVHTTVKTLLPETLQLLTNSVFNSASTEKLHFLTTSNLDTSLSKLITSFTHLQSDTTVTDIQTPHKSSEYEEPSTIILRSLTTLEVGASFTSWQSPLSSLSVDTFSSGTELINVSPECDMLSREMQTFSIDSMTDMMSSIVLENASAREAEKSSVEIQPCSTLQFELYSSLTTLESILYPTELQPILTTPGGKTTLTTIKTSFIITEISTSSNRLQPFNTHLFSEDHSTIQQDVTTTNVEPSLPPTKHNTSSETQTTFDNLAELTSSYHLTLTKSDREVYSQDVDSSLEASEFEQNFSGIKTTFTTLDVKKISTKILSNFTTSTVEEVTKDVETTSETLGNEHLSTKIEVNLIMSDAIEPSTAQKPTLTTVDLETLSTNDQLSLITTDVQTPFTVLQPSVTSSSAVTISSPSTTPSVSTSTTQPCHNNHDVAPPSSTKVKPSQTTSVPQIKSTLPMGPTTLSSTPSPTPTSQASCPNTTKADIIFLMDASSSIGGPNWNSLIEFSSNLTRGFSIGPDKVLFGAVTFNSGVRKIFDLSSYKESDSLAEALSMIPYEKKSGTKTGLGLRFIKSQVLFKAAAGGRDDAIDIVILITDGRASDPMDAENAAKDLKSDGVTIICVGVGSAVNLRELEALASDPKFVFASSSYKVLDTIKSDLIRAAC